MTRVGLLGSRGYVGQELVRLLVQHPQVEIGAMASETMAGQPVSQSFDELESSALQFQSITPQLLTDPTIDVWLLAQSNGWVSDHHTLLESSPAKLIDLSADCRFDPNWIYGLADRNAAKISKASRVANPGCYATGCQLALLPVLSQIVHPPNIFGVSGYSGAGHRPSPKNDPQRLKDNLLPYSLTDHVHEREVSFQLDQPVHFMPHVASFFRGISLTVSVELDGQTDPSTLLRKYQQYYREQPRIEVVADPPEIRDVAGTSNVRIGGFHTPAANPRRFVVVTVLDNLLKGAASQAVQNMNLMCGYPFDEGLER